MTAQEFPKRPEPLPGHDMVDPKMEQIRDLLLGEYIQSSQARFEEFDRRLRQLEQKVDQGLDAMKARLDALAAQVGADNRTAFDELAKSIEDLAHRARQIPRD